MLLPSPHHRNSKLDFSTIRLIISLKLGLYIHCSMLNRCIISHTAYGPALTHKNRKCMPKRCAGFRHFGEVNYSYPRPVVHCALSDIQTRFIAEVLQVLYCNVKFITNINCLTALFPYREWMAKIYEYRFREDYRTFFHTFKEITRSLLIRNNMYYREISQNIETTRPDVKTSL